MTYVAFVGGMLCLILAVNVIFIANMGAILKDISRALEVIADSARRY